MYHGDLYDMFVSSATAEEMADADPAGLARQVGELRAHYDALGTPDGLAMTNAEIAEAIQAHAQSLIDATPDTWLPV